MQNYAFQIPSGITLIPDVSGQSFIGTVSKPFGSIYADIVYVSGASAAGTYVAKAGDTMTGTLNAPVLSGTTISGSTITLGGNNVIVSGTSSGTGYAIFNGKDTNNLVFNTITGIGTVTATTSNGLISISGASASWAGGEVTSTVFPNSSGALAVGTVALPFASGIFNQYGTTLYTTTISGINITGVNTTIDWNNGSAQIMDFTLADSGTHQVAFSNGLAGSFYVLNTISSTGSLSDIAWSGGSWLWRGGTTGTMTLASGSQDVFSFFYNGTKYLGNSGKGYA